MEVLRGPGEGNEVQFEPMGYLSCIKEGLSDIWSGCSYYEDYPAGEWAAEGGW